MSKRLLELAGIVREGSHIEMDAHNLRVCFAHYALSWALEKTDGNHVRARELLHDTPLEDILPTSVLQSGLELAGSMDDHSLIHHDQSLVRFNPTPSQDHPKSSYRVK